MNLARSNEPVYIYPDDDLVEILVSIFFERVNVTYPILHEPTFRKMLLEKQHLWDTSYGMTVLLVCAVASRFSSDPRVLLPDDSSSLSSGWRWFSQVPIHRNALFYKSTIYDLQYYVVSDLYSLSFLSDLIIACDHISYVNVHTSYWVDYSRSCNATRTGKRHPSASRQ